MELVAITQKSLVEFESTYIYIYIYLISVINFTIRLYCLTDTTSAKDLAIQILFLTRKGIIVRLHGNLLKYMCALYLSFSSQCLFKVPDFPTPALPMMAILIRR